MMYDFDEEVLKNGVVGSLAGWRLGGKSYTPEGELIDEVHGKDCFCCGDLNKK